MSRALVVPTIREKSINKFLESWETEFFDEIIIIEDNPTRTFNIQSIQSNQIRHYSWEEIDEFMQENSWIISRRDSAIRAFGFILAKDHDYVFTLDDDCYRIPEENFIISHINNLHASKWTELIPGMRTRGIPYKNIGQLNNMMNVGLWTNIPDLDAMNQLLHPVEDFTPNVQNRIIPNGQYFPFTGMNFCFRKEVAVLSYFPLMGEGYPYRRFDDIWFGIICKKICDHLNYNISCGHPFVKHMKASDPFVNLIKEAPGIKMNETFWEEVDKIKLFFHTPKECMYELGFALSESTDEYMSKIGKAIMIWTTYF